jgi:hypothetical protein
MKHERSFAISPGVALETDRGALLTAFVRGRASDYGPR